MNVTIIGGGLVGMATALELRRSRPDIHVRIIEKENALGRHQSTHNSGVLHAGLYYKPGTLKARLAVQGIRRMKSFCERHAIAHEICGKVVVATSEAEVARLRLLLERGNQNGLRGIKWLNREQLLEIEPYAEGIAAVHVPEEGIVDYHAVCFAMERELRELGVEIVLRAKVVRALRVSSQWRIFTSDESFPSDFIIGCAGLHSDRVAEAAGETRSARIIPFRGEYYQLKPQARHFVRNLIYPVPDPVFPFLGVHFTRMIEGGIEAGPNAVLSLSREGYEKWSVNIPDMVDALTYKGLWRFLNQHRHMVRDEAVRSLSKKQFCRSLQKLVPAIQESDLESGGAGVRAQAMLSDGTLVQDFHFQQGDRSLHVLNAPSPAATASLAIGGHIAQLALESVGFSNLDSVAP